MWSAMIQCPAREFILNAKDADIVKPWDQKGYKMPGGTPYTPSGL